MYKETAYFTSQIGKNLEVQQLNCQRGYKKTQIQLYWLKNKCMDHFLGASWTFLLK